MFFMRPICNSIFDSVVASYHRSSFFLLFLSLLAAPVLTAQEVDPSEVAFVRLVNLVSPGEGNLQLELDGSVPWPAGYKLGQRTGGLGLKAGEHKFVLSKKGCLTAERDVKLTGGKTVTLAVFADAVRDEQGEIIDWQIKMAELSQKDPGPGYYLTFVSFCQDENVLVRVTPTAGESFSVELSPRRTVRRKFATDRDRVAITHDEKVLDVLKGRRAGNYVVMVYDGVEGKEAVSFYDPKFVVGE